MVVYWSSHCKPADAAVGNLVGLGPPPPPMPPPAPPPPGCQPAALRNRARRRPRPAMVLSPYISLPGYVSVAETWQLYELPLPGALVVLAADGNLVGAGGGSPPLTLHT